MVEEDFFKKNYKKCENRGHFEFFSIFNLSPGRSMCHDRPDSRYFKFLGTTAAGESLIISPERKLSDFKN